MLPWLQIAELALWSTFSGIFKQESKIFGTNCLSYLFSSLLVKIWLSVQYNVTVIFWLILHILETLRSLKGWETFENTNSILLLLLATCLCFKMTLIGKLRFSSYCSTTLNSQWHTIIDVIIRCVNIEFFSLSQNDELNNVIETVIVFVFLLTASQSIYSHASWSASYGGWTVYKMILCVL